MLNTHVLDQGKKTTNEKRKTVGTASYENQERKYTQASCNSQCRKKA